MMNRRYRRSGVLLWLAVLLCAACSKSAPEEAILANLKSMQAGLEERKLGKAMEFLADDFVGNDGVGKDTIKRILLGEFLQHKTITVVVTRLEVRVREHDPYSADMTATVAATGAENLLPQEGHIYRAEGEWRNINDEWLLVRLRWE